MFHSGRVLVVIMTDPVTLWVTGASCGLLVGIFIGCIGGEWWNAKTSREAEGEKLDMHQIYGEAYCDYSHDPAVGFTGKPSVRIRPSTTFENVRVQSFRICGLSITSPSTHEVTKYSCGDPECPTCYPMTREQANEINQRFLQERGYGALKQTASLNIK